jgi:hypothetical protein
VQLFPERDLRGRRWFLIAVLLSLFIHFAGGSLWAFFARVTHQGGRPEDQVVARIETITVERRPRPTAPPQPPAAPALAVPRARVPLPEAPQLAVPTLAPRAEPTPKPDARLRRLPSRVAATVPVPNGARGRHAAAGALSAEQITALEGSFRKTIDQAQQAVAETPVPHPQVALTKQYNDVLRGSINDIVGGSGICYPLDNGTVRGPYTYYYLTCSIKYTDGYAESVSFPWPFHFSRGNDPFASRNGPQRFPPQPPPPGFVLSHPFALSRALCTYYHDECAAVLERERAAGGTASGGS